MGEGHNRKNLGVKESKRRVIEYGMYMKVMKMVLKWQHLKVSNGSLCNKNKNYMNWEEAEKGN